MRKAILLAAMLSLAALRAQASGALALAAVGSLEPGLLENLGRGLEHDLGISTRILALDLEPGSVTRDARWRWLDDQKANVRQYKVMLAALRKAAKAKGISGEAMWDDGNFFALLPEVLKATGDGEDEIEEVAKEGARLMGKERQWDTANEFSRLKKAAQKSLAPGETLLGVTAKDLSDGKNMFQLGAACPGAALISYARFTPEFTRERADPFKLAVRVKKQALASLGDAWGAPRCVTKGCARYPVNSVPDFDLNGETLCARCLRAMTFKAAK